MIRVTPNGTLGVYHVASPTSACLSITCTVNVEWLCALRDLLSRVAERLRPSVLYVAHNAHYDATFPIPTPARRNKVYEYLGLNAEQAAPYVEHNGSLDMLRAVVMYFRRMQQGYGVVAVSPRWGNQQHD